MSVVGRLRLLLLISAAAAAAAAGALGAAGPAAAAPPAVSAPSAIVVEISTGDVAFERRPDQRRPIASVTKLMTALLTLEAGGPLAERVPATRYRASAAESRIELRPGERLTRADLLRGLLLASANDAAIALAEDGGSRRAFVRDMNRRARRLGLRSTRFVDPIGLGPGNVSTARDLVGLTLQLRRFPFFQRTVDRPAATLRSGARVRQIVNRNTLVREIPSVSGVKTGHTSRAGYVLVGSATRRGITLVSVVLGTPSDAARIADTRALLDDGFARYSRRRAVARGAVLAKAPIRYRRGAELELVAQRTVRRVVRRTGPRPAARVIDAPADVEGPIRRGQRLGTAEILVGRDRVATVALVAAVSVPEAGAGQKAKDYVTRPLGFGLAVAVLAGTVALLVRRRGKRTRPPRSRRREVGAT